jgi:hypothetical protein
MRRDENPLSYGAPVRRLAGATTRRCNMFFRCDDADKKMNVIQKIVFPKMNDLSSDRNLLV